MPAAVPDLDPGMIAAFVRPQRRPHRPRRDADRAAGIDEDDGKPGAGRHAERLRFARALVRALAAGVVVDPVCLEELPVQRLRRLAGRLRFLHHRPRPLQEILPPRLARLVEDRVGQHVVVEDILRHRLRPRELLAGLECQIEIGGEEFLRERLLVLLRHARHQELRRLSAGLAVVRFRLGDEIIHHGTRREAGQEYRKSEPLHVADASGTGSPVHLRDFAGTRSPPPPPPPARPPGRPIPSRSASRR